VPYAIAIIRYRKPFDEVSRHLEQHRAYLQELKQRGTLLVSGPFEPRNGGALLLRFADGVHLAAELDRVRDNDPYTQAGVAQYELLPWNPLTGKESLDRLA
jgi:uncharacterized protein YciI